MSLSSETKDGITTITVDYPYYISLRIKKYFQHHDQAGAEAAAHEFLENSAKRGVKHITSSVTHNEARQHYLAVYTMKERG